MIRKTKSPSAGTVLPTPPGVRPVHLLWVALLLGNAADCCGAIPLILQEVSWTCSFGGAQYGFVQSGGQTWWLWAGNEHRISTLPIAATFGIAAAVGLALGGAFYFWQTAKADADGR